MRKIIVIIIFLLSTGVYSQKNSQNVSPIHTGTHSNNNISYVVGKIYVLPPPIIEKEEKEEEKVSNNIKIYPNSVTNILTIETFDKSEIKIISIYDMSGKLVFSNTLENNSVDVSFLHQGTYIIILDNDYTKNFKIIKN